MAVKSVRRGAKAADAPKEPAPSDGQDAPVDFGASTTSPAPPAPAVAKPINEAVQALQEIMLRVSNDSSGTWMGLDVTMPQMKVLLLLREHGALRVGVLARHLTVSTPTITGIVDRLVRQGLVRREDDPTDRRVVLNALTARGEGLMDRLRNRGGTELSRALDTLSAQEQADLARLLTRVMEQLDSGSGSVAAD